MSLAARLAERRELIAKYVPADTQATHRRVVEELRASGLEQRVLKAGDASPDFELPDQNNVPVLSRELLAQGPLIVVFLRGRWCPFCVATVEAWNEKLPQVRQSGAWLLAISPMTVKHGYFMHDQHKLAYPLLSDAGSQVARQFGLVYRVPDYQQAIYSKTFVNLPFLHGEPSWELSIPATFVIGRDRRIQFAAASADYTQRAEPAEVLQHLAA